MRGLRSVGLLDIAGYVLGGGAETLGLVSVDELDALLADGAELIDVREKDERDTGYIAGSRNIPYRLLALGAGRPPERPADRHDLRVGPARRDRGEHPRRARLRRTRGRERRHRLLGGSRQADRRVPPLRQLSRPTGSDPGHVRGHGRGQKGNKRCAERDPARGARASR